MRKALARKPRPSKRRSHSEQTADPVETSNEGPPEDTPAFIEGDQRHAMIARQAYYLAEDRGFEPGHELDDWLTAESNVEQDLAASGDESTLCGE